MVMQKGGCVYILTNKEHSVLYTGVTADIVGRIYQHKHKVYPNSFTARYNCNKLVYYCFYAHIEEAIAEEKRIKGTNRNAKIVLVDTLNPKWDDLYAKIVQE